MKLLFDENLSRKLVKLLAQEYPGSIHVVLCGLERSDDAAIRQYALQHELIIVTQDEDFSLLSAALGASPKVVWLRRGNAPTSEVARILKTNKEQIEASAADPERYVLMIY